MQRFASQREVARLQSFPEETRRVCSLSPETALLCRHAGEITVIDAMREDGVIPFRANCFCLHPLQPKQAACCLCTTRLRKNKSAKLNVTGSTAPPQQLGFDFASAPLAHAVPTAASGGVFAPSLAVTIIGLTDLC